MATIVVMIFKHFRPVLFHERACKSYPKVGLQILSQKGASRGVHFLWLRLQQMSRWQSCSVSTIRCLARNETQQAKEFTLSGSPARSLKPVSSCKRWPRRLLQLHWTPRLRSRQQAQLLTQRMEETLPLLRKTCAHMGTPFASSSAMPTENARGADASSSCAHMEQLMNFQMAATAAQFCLQLLFSTAAVLLCCVHGGDRYT